MNEDQFDAVVKFLMYSEERPVTEFMLTHLYPKNISVKDFKKCLRKITEHVIQSRELLLSKIESNTNLSNKT